MLIGFAMREEIENAKIKTPETADDLASSRREYSMAGQEGCVGSGDGTRVT